MALIAPDTLTRLLGQFQSRAREAFAAPDPGTAGTAAGRATLRAEAHALAAASGLLGFMPLSRACAALEQAGDDVTFDALLARARDLAVAAVAETRTLLSGGPASLRTASGAR